MKVRHPSMFYAVGLLAFGACVHEAAATTQVVSFNRLTESATVAPALQSGDALVLDTLVTQETGSSAAVDHIYIGVGVQPAG